MSTNKFPSYISFSYSPVDFVPVIASFDTDGNLKPLYVRINGTAMKVHSYHERQHYRNTIEFNCKIIETVDDETYLRPLLLTYHQAERVWTIPQQPTKADD